MEGLNKSEEIKKDENGQEKKSILNLQLKGDMVGKRLKEIPGLEIDNEKALSNLEIQDWMVGKSIQEILTENKTLISMTPFASGAGDDEGNYAYLYKNEKVAHEMLTEIESKNSYWFDTEVILKGEQ